MNQKIIVTNDNSHSIYVEQLNETYHSINGAVTESKHIYINQGLAVLKSKSLNVFEMGFGTGLNALLSFEHAQHNKVKVNYETCEKYPINADIVNSLNFDNFLNLPESSIFFYAIHAKTNFNNYHFNNFDFTKYHADFIHLDLKSNFFDICFYDAFGPKVQPELWTETAMKKVYKALKSGGFLITYCAQGEFKRNLIKAGFEIKSLAGPPGKREITQAWKTE